MTFDADEALDLLDWKRQVFALYEQVRASSDPSSAWELWHEARDRLLREHPQSPLPAERRADFPGCRYFEYDARARVLARVESSEPVRKTARTSQTVVAGCDRLPFGSTLLCCQGECWELA
jgi:hypothetical protein